MQFPEAHISLVEPRSHFVDRIRLHEVAAGGAARTLELAPLCEKLGVEHVPRRMLALHGTRVALDDGSTCAADAVILAMGSRTRPPPGPAHVVDDPSSAQALYEALADHPTARVTVIGAGATALEVTLALAHRFPQARLAIWRAEPGWGYPERASRTIEARLTARRVTLVDGGKVTELTPHRARSTRHERDHDLAVWCAGFLPCPVELPGRRMPDGRLAVDSTLQLAPGVFGAGDLVVPPNPHRLGCVTALPMGAHAATNVAHWLRGEPLEPFLFRDVAACIALDPGFGLAQPLGPDGSPREGSLGGRAGGLVKAVILASVSGVLSLERTLGLPVYRWAQPSAPALVEEAP
jgi:NADH dehydrogenase FAD-containing subunit